MTTLAEPTGPAKVGDFHALFAPARRRVTSAAGSIRELRIELDGPPLWARSRLLTCAGLMFVQGENRAAEAMLLEHLSSAPIIAVHATLRGSAIAWMDGLGSTIASRAGQVQLFASPTSHSRVQLPAHVSNEAFRIIFPPAWLSALAERHPELEAIARHVTSGRPYRGSCVTPAPLPSLMREAAEIMHSEQYGAQRGLFLEARATSWLALALALPTEDAHAPLAAREVERMHEARDLLLARLSNPPTLAELAGAIGTNDFALKRNFKRVFGQPVHSYLLSVRLAHAGRLLADTSDSLKEIAGALGYAHANHFITAFRRAYGMTPARYRSAVRNGARPGPRARPDE
jgi:AraC-like DNA-binding protein